MGLFVTWAYKVRVCDTRTKYKRLWFFGDMLYRGAFLGMYGDGVHFVVLWWYARPAGGIVLIICVLGGLVLAQMGIVVIWWYSSRAC